MSVVAEAIITDGPAPPDTLRRDSLRVSVVSLTALRMFRIVSVLQMIKGAGFAVFGAVLLWGWDRGPAAIIAGNSLATLLAAVVGLFWIWPAWRSLPPGAPCGASGHVTHRQLW